MNAQQLLAILDRVERHIADRSATLTEATIAATGNTSVFVNGDDTVTVLYGGVSYSDPRDDDLYALAGVLRDVIAALAEIEAGG